MKSAITSIRILADLNEAGHIQSSWMQSKRVVETRESEQKQSSRVRTCHKSLSRQLYQSWCCWRASPLRRERVRASGCCCSPRRGSSWRPPLSYGLHASRSETSFRDHSTHQNLAIIVCIHYHALLLELIPRRREIIEIKWIWRGYYKN